MMEFFFDGGARWASRTYCTDDGKRCPLGALEYVRCETGHSDDCAVQYLARAINLRQLAKGLPPLGNTNTMTIIGFNDSFGRSFKWNSAELTTRDKETIAQAAMHANGS